MFLSSKLYPVSLKRAQSVIFCCFLLCCITKSVISGSLWCATISSSGAATSHHSDKIPDASMQQSVCLVLVFEFNSQCQWWRCAAAGPATVLAVGWGCVSRASVRAKQSRPSWLEKWPNSIISSTKAENYHTYQYIKMDNGADSPALFDHLILTVVVARVTVAVKVSQVSATASVAFSVIDMSLSRTVTR